MRERLLADGHDGARGRRRRRRRQHVLRHARGGAQVAPGRAASGAHARRVYVTGCGANLVRGRLRGPAARTSVVVAQRERGDAGVRRRRRRRDRLRPGRRAARPRARVREGAGRLQLLVRLLRDPARARRLAQPRRRRPCSREVRRRVEQGHREVVLTGINLGCYRDREAGLHACRGSSARRARPRGSRGCGSPRSRSTTSTPSSSPRCARRRPSPPPARAAPVGRRRRAARDGPPLHASRPTCAASSRSRATST